MPSASVSQRDRGRTFIETIQQLAQRVPARDEDGDQA